MDITEALAPVSDQLDAIELAVPRTFTIAAGGRIGERDGKKVAELRFVDFPRVWRPSKGMLDLLAACWGIDGSQWVGRSVTLYNDPSVMFGRDKVGGIRVSHMSHIDGPRNVSIRAAGQGGRKQTWHVDPLPDTLASVHVPDRAHDAPDLDGITDLDTLRGMYPTADPDTQKAILARVDALKAVTS